MTLTLPWYYGAGAILISLASAGYGWWRLQVDGWSYKVAAAWLFAVLAGPVAAPGILTDELVMNERKLQWTWGFWFARDVRELPLAGLRTVFVEKRKGRRGQEHDVWILRYRDGRLEEVDPPDLIEANIGAVRAHMEDLGVSFAGPRGTGSLAP